MFSGKIACDIESNNRNSRKLCSFAHKVTKLLPVVISVYSTVIIGLCIASARLCLLFFNECTDVSCNFKHDSMLVGCAFAPPNWEQVEGFRPEWCISTIYYCRGRDTPFWSKTFEIVILESTQQSHPNTAMIIQFLFFNFNLILFLFLNMSCCRHVILPQDVAKLVPKHRLMIEVEWRNLGVQQSPGWVHYMVHEPGLAPHCSRGSDVVVLVVVVVVVVVIVLL